MCCFRQVCYIYTVCGHAFTMPDQPIPCDNSRCKFSPQHPAGCSGVNCKKSCWQYRQPPQQYSPQMPELCPGCARR